MNTAKLQMMIIGLTATLCLAAATLAAPGATSDAITEAHKTFNSGDYRQTLREISKGLSLTAPESVSDEKYQLLMFRGESLLRIGQWSLASDAFAAATNTAPDIREAATAKASAVLIRLSNGPLYQPTGGTGEPIPIVPPDLRKYAMRTAFTDLRERHMAANQKALEGDTLPPMLELVPPLGDMFVLEIASQGQATQTTGILCAFGEHARSLMDAELRRARRRVASLDELANSLIDADRIWGSRLDRRGLRSPERADLQELREYAGRIRDAALHGRRIVRSFGLEGEDWDPVIAEADEVLDLARTTWERRF
jgi:hypothetical protein